jgi:hypothetical protein
MAKPMTPEQWLAALRAEGVTDIVEMPGWRSNNRNHIKAFTDVHATMIHHTAGEGPGLPNLVFNGTADLPGPLCHDYLDRTGRLYLVGNGRANHAGTVARNAYDAVLNERSTHPYPDAAEPIDGNSVSYGLECENSGASGRAWTAKQYDVAVRVQAARCRFHGWSANSVWAHKEATRRKPVDPRLPMDQFRADVAERLAHDPSWNPTEETDVAFTDADAKKFWYADHIPAVPPPYNNADWHDGNETWTAKYALGTVAATGRETLARVKTIEEKVTSLHVGGVDLDALATKVADLLAARLAN